MMMTTTTMKKNKVEREKLAACMTCPLCHNLFRRPTTISECLHSFCRRCIYKKLTDEDLEHCPVCHIHLGATPLDKLRPDHCLQDIRAKIFPYKRKRTGAEAQSPKSVPKVVPEAVPPPFVPKAPTPSPQQVATVPIPAKRKERSLSSLVTNTPKVQDIPMQVQAVKKSKSRAKKVGPVWKHDDEPINNVDDDPRDRLSSPETLAKIAQSRRKNGTTSQPSKRHKSKQGTELCEEKIDLWKPLNHLVEPASTSKVKSSKSNPPQEVLVPASDDKANENNVVSKSSVVKEPSEKQKVCEDELDSGTSKPGSVEPMRSNAVTQEKTTMPEVINVPAQAATFENSRPEQRLVNPRIWNDAQGEKAATLQGMNVPAQAAVDANSRHERRLLPVWFSLIASKNQGEGAPLPQIPSPYLRVKDGDLPISAIKKYIAQKLCLASEDEVELCTGGQPLPSTLQLRQLVQWWLQSVPSERVCASVGSSAKDLVMALFYCRKAQPS